MIWGGYGSIPVYGTTVQPQQKCLFSGVNSGGANGPIELSCQQLLRGMGGAHNQGELVRKISKISGPEPPKIVCFWPQSYRMFLDTKFLGKMV